MRLTDTAIKDTKGRDKPYELFDRHGLFLLVNPDGRTGWRLKYRYHGKEEGIAPRGMRRSRRAGHQ